jgi:hypothetical protein
MVCPCAGADSEARDAVDRDIVPRHRHSPVDDVIEGVLRDDEESAGRAAVRLLA